MRAGVNRRLFFFAAFSVVALDLAAKLVAENHLLRSTGLRVFGEWFQLRLVYNPGAAFGIHVGPYSRWVFFVIALVAIVVLYRMSSQARPGDWLRQLALGLVTGGAAGNLIDRIRSPQGVVDFIDIGVGATRWPTFNIADIAVSIGAITLAYSLWREDVQAAQTESASAS